MDVSVWPSPANAWSDTLEVATYADRSGWHGVWFADHFLPNEAETSGPVLECFSVLAGLATATERVRLGSLVAGITYRHPAVLANQAAAIDQISGGRFVFGIGAGWQQNEHDAYGIRLGSIGERLARFEEACVVLRSLLANPTTTFEGSHYELRDAPLEPKGVQSPLPLLIGAKGEQVALRLVATHADEWNAWGSPELMAAKGAVLDQHCERVGRDPGTIRRSTQAFFEVVDDAATADRRRSRTEGAGRPAAFGTAEELRDIVGRYAEAGIDELIVPDWALGTGTRRHDALERLRTEVFLA